MDEQQKPTTSGFRAGIEIGPDGEQTGNIICYPSDDPNCKVVREPKPGVLDSTGFLSLPEPAPFHDEVLISATAEINEILVKIMPKQDQTKGNLHVIFSEDGPMLAWVRSRVRATDDIPRITEIEHN